MGQYERFKDASGGDVGLRGSLMVLTHATIFIDRVLDDSSVKRECMEHLVEAGDILREEDLKRRKHDVHDD